MTAVSKTLKIENTTFETIASLASITLTSSKTYSMQIQNIAEVKIADAIFTFENEKFQITQADDDIYIRTLGIPAVLTILENA
jgi:hypothetical protein